MSATATLLTPTAYIKDATKRINAATTRVSFLSMVLTEDNSTDDLLNALAAAAKRGVDVHVAADMFTYSELSGVFIPSHYYSKKVRTTTRMARKLTASGVHFHWLGRLNTTTFSGRTHSKWCVVDDTVYSFGGVNLYQEGITNVDYMFRLHDAPLAAQLVTEHRRIVRADKGRYAYKSHRLTSVAGTILVDGGLLGDSVIYRRAIKLAQQSERAVLVSQYCPTGKLARALRQTKTTFYFNPWQKAHGFNRFVIRTAMFVSGQITNYQREGYLHAKFIIFTLPDGKKIAITGSHNFVHGGVLLGTREVALETDDPKIIAQLEQFVTERVA